MIMIFINGIISLYLFCLHSFQMLLCLSSRKKCDNENLFINILVRLEQSSLVKRKPKIEDEMMLIGMLIEWWEYDRGSQTTSTD